MTPRSKGPQPGGISWREQIPAKVKTFSQALADGFGGPDIGPPARGIRAVVMLQEVNQHGEVVGRRMVGQACAQVFGSLEQYQMPDEHHAGRLEHMAGAALHDLLRELNPSELVGVFMQAMRKDGGA